MKKSGNFFSALKKNLEKTAWAASVVPYALGAIFILYAVLGGGESAYLVCGLIMICAAVFVQIGGTITNMFPGPHSDFVTDYDRHVIGKAFLTGNKRYMFYSALCELHKGDINDALDTFRELKNQGLTETEQGVLGFFTAVCYNRMGYPTNAGHCAAIAVDKDICRTEALLMAARSFSMAGSFSESAEYYERLVPIAESEGMFPFIYNEMGRMYLTANKPANSRIYFEKAVEYGLDPITAQGGLALVNLLEGKEDEACEMYRLALIARIGDADGYKEYCAQICTANGYPENFFEEHLKARYCREEAKR